MAQRGGGAFVRPTIIWHGLPLRAAYYLSLLALFAGEAFYVGPHLILFHQLRTPVPADFAAPAQQTAAPVVSAMLGFRADHGRLPRSRAELIPAYLHDTPWGLYIDPATSSVTYQTSITSESISYQFAGPRVGWWVQGFFVTGPIPNLPEPRPATSQPVGGSR